LRSLPVEYLQFLVIHALESSTPSLSIVVRKRFTSHEKACTSYPPQTNPSLPSLGDGPSYPSDVISTNPVCKRTTLSTEVPSRQVFYGLAKDPLIYTRHLHLNPVHFTCSTVVLPLPTFASFVKPTSLRLAGPPRRRPPRKVIRWMGRQPRNLGSS